MQACSKETQKGCGGVGVVSRLLQWLAPSAGGDKKQKGAKLRPGRGGEKCSGR